MSTTGETVAARLVLRPQKNPEITIIHLCLWIFALLFGVPAIFSRLLSDFILSVLFIAGSVVHTLYMHTKQITVSDSEIMVQCFGLFRRKINWEQIQAYQLIHKAGTYPIRKTRGAIGGYREERYTIRLEHGGIFPLRISNRYSNYKQFKQILKDKRIRQLKTIHK